MTALASNGWSAVAAASAAPIQVGYAVTTSSDGKGMVIATDAAVTASSSGVVEGVAVTAASARMPFILYRTGKLEPKQAPFVGVGNATDYAVRDSLGRIVRQAAFGANVLGFCGKDGSVTLLLGAGSLTAGGGGGGAGFLTGTVDGTVTGTGQVLTTANDSLDSGKMARATTANLKRGFLVTGITLTVPVLGIVAYAVPGATVPATLLGFAATGTTSWAVVDASGNVVRKTNPEAQDIVVGEVNERGNLYFWERIRPNSEIVVSQAPYFADNTGVTSASDAFRQAFADASFTGILLAYSCKPVRIPKGLYLLDKPVNIQQRALRVLGEGEFTTSLRTQNYVGPTFYVSAQLGTFPVTPNVMGGRQALVFAHKALPRDTKWLVLSDDGAGTWYHGKNQFCVQWKGILNTTTATGINFFIASYGKRATDDNGYGYSEAFGCGFSGVGNGIASLRNTILFTMTTTAGIKSVYSNTGTMVPNDNTIREIEWNWSGGFMRIYIDGVEQALLNATGSAGDTGALAGTIVQNSWETTYMGIVNQYFTSNFEFYSVDTQTCSIRGSDIARHPGGNYTPNFVNRYTNDANTMFGLAMANGGDSEDLDGIFVRGVARATAAGSGAIAAYFPLRCDNVGTVPSTYDVTIEKVAITNVYGTCILTDSSPQTTLRDLNLSGQIGMAIDANSFFSRVENVKISGLNLARIGLRGAAAVNTCVFANLYIIGFDYGMVISSGADLNMSKSVFIVACKKGYMLFIAVGGINAAGCDIFMTDENSLGAVPDYFFFISACDTATFANAVVAQAENANAPVWAFSGQGTFGPSRFLLLAPDIGAHPSSTGAMKFLPSCVGQLEVSYPSETANVPRFRSAFLPPAGMTVTFRPDSDMGTLTFALSNADYTVTLEQHTKGLLEFTGALTADRTIIMPAIRAGARTVSNRTTGGFNLVFRMSGGVVGHTVAPNASATLRVNNAVTELVRST